MLHFCKDFGKYSPLLQNVPFSPKSPLSKGTLCYLQRRSQDFLRGTHNSPNRFAPLPPYPPPPRPPIKTFLIKGLSMLSLRVFFCLWITLSGVWVHWLMYLTHLSHNKTTYFSGFVTLFCYWVRFVVLSRCSACTRIEKVPIWSSLYGFRNRNLKWIRCLVNSQCFVA